MERTSEDAVAETDHADGTLEKRFTRVLLTVFLCVCVCHRDPISPGLGSDITLKGSCVV